MDMLRKLERDRANLGKESGSARRRRKAIQRRDWVCQMTHIPLGSAVPGCDSCEFFAMRLANANKPDVNLGGRYA